MIITNPNQFINQVKSQSPDFKLLGLDIGDKKIGIGMVNSIVLVPMPFSILVRTNIKKDISAIKKLASDQRINGIVVGLPFQMDGQEGEQAQKVRSFITKLAKQVDLPIIFEDERMTTKIANTMLGQGGVNRKQRALVDDQVSAQLILASFLKRI